MLLQVQPMAPAPDASRAWPRLDRGTLALSPIDHGFCLPEALEPPYFEWLHWPQVCRAARFDAAACRCALGS